jgi:hypothetical protein
MEAGVEITIRLPTTEREGNTVLLAGTDHRVVVRLVFGSEAQLKRWLLDITVAVLGEVKAELLTGETLSE